jgi:hypothetical protein
MLRERSQHAPSEPHIMIVDPFKLSLLLVPITALTLRVLLRLGTSREPIS